MNDSEQPTPLTDPKAVDVAQASSLCTQCGLCCMGVLHARAVLEATEIVSAREIGLPVLEDREAFALPCPMLVDRRCSIFGRRPAVCSRYRCQVLIDQQDHGLAEDEALARVRRAQGLIEDLRTCLPAGMGFHETQALVGSAIEGDEYSGELRLRSTLLQLFLDKYFRTPKEGKALVMTPIDKRGDETGG